jgi:hypothetical protein
MVVFETDQKPTVADLSDLMTESRQGFLGSCLQHLIEEKYSDSIDLEEGSCPCCGKTCTKRQVVRKKLDTMQGSCELRRTWFYCTTCERGVLHSTQWRKSVAGESSSMFKKGL